MIPFFLPGAAVASDAPTTHRVETAAAVGLENAKVRLLFDRKSGALVEMRNRATGDNYLKGSGDEGNPFRLYVDPTETPRPFVEPNDWGGRVEGALGGATLDAKDFRLTKQEFFRAKTGGSLRLTLRGEKPPLTARLTLTLPDGSDGVDAVFSVRNDDSRGHSLLAAFPHLTGLSLGSDRSSNRSLMLASFGTPGVAAWENGGGVYGRDIAMPWQAVYEPARDEGLGMMVLDPALTPKILRRFPGGGMSALSLATALAPGESFAAPPVRLVVHRGNWRVVAARYGQWFRQAFAPRKPPTWLKEVQLYAGAWVPHPDAVAAAQKAGAGFRSYADWPLLYADDPYDLKEWAQYNDGVRQNPATYGAYMADGLYRLRTDLGGEAAAKAGIETLHRMGRRVLLYVAGNSVLKDSPVFSGGKIDDWLLMDRPGHSHDIGYPNGVSVCPGYAPWQDHLAAVCARLLRETGADGVRLDELATVVPCVNPAHRHASPYEGIQWLRTLTRKVRAAMDAVNPDTLLLTEGPLDALAESCDGALQMFGPGRDLDAMRVALPAYRIIAYHPGAVEAARNGLIAGRTTARRTEFPWSHRGLSGRPADYAQGSGPALRWHELRATFAEAMDEGAVAAEDPAAADEPRWIGRLWSGKRFSVLIGGAEDGRPLPGAVRVRLAGLPVGVDRAVAFDIETGERETVPVTRRGGAAWVTLSGRFTAALLPGPSCPPLAALRLPETLRRGESAEVAVRIDRASPRRIAVRAPGLSAPERVDAPGTFRLSAPPGAVPGLYPVRLEGRGILPVKAWVRVVP